MRVPFQLPSEYEDDALEPVQGGDDLASETWKVANRQNLSIALNNNKKVSDAIDIAISGANYATAKYLQTKAKA